MTVEDRRFRIQVAIDSWEETNPIFLGEALDQHLGLDSLEEQEEFIRSSGFNSVPAVDKHLLPRSYSPRPHSCPHQELPGASLALTASNFPPLRAPSSVSRDGASCDLRASVPGGIDGPVDNGVLIAPNPTPGTSPVPD